MLRYIVQRINPDEIQSAVKENLGRKAKNEDSAPT
jgi:hypothetical protein